MSGATGFVGQVLLGELSLRGHKVIPVVRRISGLPREVIIHDISKETDWSAALAGCQTVVHLAARVHVMCDEASDPMAEFRRVNVESTLNLARQAAAAHVKRFVFLSSVKVNGETTEPGQKFSADDAPAPQDAYSISKMEAEQGLREICARTGMEVVIIRSPLVYGLGVKGNFASMLRWVRKGMPLPFGAVNNKRSLVALENLVDFIALCADPDRSPRAANEVFLISDGEDVSTSELLRKVANAYNVTPRLLPVPANLIQTVTRLLGKRDLADRLLGSLVVDSSKARNLLGWKPVISMDDQLKMMALHDTRI